MAEKITKQEAVRRALAQLGRDAKPTQIKGWVKEQFNIDMGTDHISTAKGGILKAGRKGKRTAKKKPATSNTAAKQVPAAKPQAGIPLDDILYVKRLVGRFGPDQLHTLINAFAK
jgi:hypothetical protein